MAGGAASGRTNASFRFYAELNYFIAPHRRQRRFDCACARDASVKHMIEALGVPHTEVALILVNDAPVDFSWRLREHDRVSVYPHFLTLAVDGAPFAMLQPPGLPAFVADAHLGRLARDLRMLGFDALYRNDFTDDDIVRIAMRDGRIVLTRDRDLLMRKGIALGCYVYATESEAQLRDVMARYRLGGMARPLSRCLNCNGLLQDVPRHAVERQVPARSGACLNDFRRCAACGQVYWEGSHVARMRRRIASLLEAMRPPD